MMQIGWLRRGESGLAFLRGKRMGDAKKGTSRQVAKHAKARIAFFLSSQHRL
jgi:hypothetical protein